MVRTGERLKSMLRSADADEKAAARADIAKAVKAARGDVAAAAKKLGLDARTVRRWAPPEEGDAGTPRRSAAGKRTPAGAAARSKAGSAPKTTRAKSPKAKSEGKKGAPDAAKTRAATTPAKGKGARPAAGAQRKPAVPKTAPATSPAPPPATPAPPKAPPVQRPAAATVPSRPAASPQPAPAVTTVPKAVPLAAPPPAAPRRLAFVLHTHLPWVVNHGTWPHGEDWLYEAAAFCYLPLAAMLQRRQAAGAHHQLTITISPILAAQMASRRFRDEFPNYVTQRRKAAHDANGDQPLAKWWEERFVDLEEQWRGMGGDLPGAFAALARANVIELGTCAATHAYLPLVHDRRSIGFQLELARNAHKSLFGLDPRGTWLPECAYRPEGAWRHPVTGASESFRPGLEHFLDRAGFAWTVLDSHLLLSGGTVPSSAGEPQAAAPHDHRDLHRPWLIGRSRVAAFFRDPTTSLQVWSREHGYPGEAAYLDFHKRHWPSGLKLWSVTHPRADLADKLPYAPLATDEPLDAQAHHFLEVVAGLGTADHGVVVAPFDTELFGHWWFEGVAWLEEVLSKIDRHPVVAATTLSSELDSHPPRGRVALPEGSWGDGGDHRVWLNPETEWMWRELGALEPAAQLHPGEGGPDEWQGAVANELLILLASDWPFLVTTGSARDYAEARFARHRDRLKWLLEHPHGALPEWAIQDAAFSLPILAQAWRKRP